MPPLLPALVVMAAAATAFKITSFHVPSYVPPDQVSVDIECSYDANFTLLNWFKGPTEFFRYRPAANPSTKSFPILGVGSIDMISCGPTECRLRLGELTEEASGLYRCDLELDRPPYKFETRTGRMSVLRHQRRKPIVEGLAAEYSEGDEIQAYCRAENNSDIRWFVNGKEMTELRGNRTFRLDSKRINMQSTDTTVIVQCAESVDGKWIGSNNAQAKWKKLITKRLVYASENTNQSCLENSSSIIVQTNFIFLTYAVFLNFILLFLHVV